MRMRLGAAVLGVLAGLLLSAGGGLAFLARDQADWHRLMSVAGYGVAILALAVLGYALVTTAPAWLKLIVSVGFPLLGFTVWQLVAEEVDRQIDGWRAPAGEHLAAGLLLLVAGLVIARGADAKRVEDHSGRGYHARHR